MRHSGLVHGRSQEVDVMKALVLGAWTPIGREVVEKLALTGQGVVVALPAGTSHEPVSAPSVRTVRGCLWQPTSVARLAAGVDVLFDCTFSDRHRLGSRAEADIREQMIATVHGAALAGVRRVVRTSASLCGLTTPDGTQGGHAHHLSVGLRGACAAEATLPGVLAVRKDVEVVTVTVPVVLGGDPQLYEGEALMLLHLLDPLGTSYPGGANFIAIADVVAAHLLLARRGKPGGRYVATGENLTWRDFHSTLRRHAGLSALTVMAHDPAAHLAVGVARYVGAERDLVPPWARRDNGDLTLLGVTGEYYWYDDSDLRSFGYRPGSVEVAVAASLPLVLNALNDRMSMLAQRSHFPERA